MSVFAKLVALSALTLTAPAIAAPDAAFLSEAVKGDNAEVSMGHMAVEKGNSAKVRDFGKMLVEDHSAHKQKLVSLGSPSTEAMTPDAIKAHDKLAGLSGAAFDKAFKEHMIEDHEKDIAKYQAQATSGQSASVKEMAEQTLPTLKKHLATAQAL